MKKVSRLVASIAVVGAVSGGLLALQASAWAQATSPLTVTNGEQKAHIMPTVSRATELPPDNGPLLYNGGPVMLGSNIFYAIYWIPAKLQNGGTTTLSAHYQAVETNLLHDYPEHSLGNNNTQYYQIASGVKTYLYNRPDGYYTYVDTNAYPSSGCNDSVTPGNCITDAQIQAEIQRVMKLKGWTPAINKIFLLFTSSGEGSCFDSSGTECAYTQYCAYHSYISTNPVTIYGNEPYGDPNYCQVPGTPSPNGDPAADTAATAAAHEMTESLTDPELNAWITAMGNEIGDLCAYNYGTNTWDSGNANQMWWGHFWEIQQMFDNHASACVLVGP